MATVIRTIQVPTLETIQTNRSVMGKVVEIRPSTHKAAVDTALKIRFQYDCEHFAKLRHTPNDTRVYWTKVDNLYSPDDPILKHSYHQTTVTIWTGARGNEHILAAAKVYCWEPDRFTKLTGRNHAVKAVIRGMPKEFVQEICDTLKAMKCRWY